MPEVSAPKYVIANLGNEGEAFVALEDGRHVLAKIKAGVTVKRGDTVAITSEGVNKDETPKDPVIVKVL